jgi:hypothetical protein
MSKNNIITFDPNAIYVNNVARDFKQLEQLFQLTGTPTLAIYCEGTLWFVPLALQTTPYQAILFFLNGTWNVSTTPLTDTVPVLRTEIQNF